MIRVIGIGSPFGDDRAAWEVIAELEKHRSRQVDLMTLNQPGASLINWIEGVGHLILIDSLISPGRNEAFLKIEPGHLSHDREQLSSHGQQLRQTLDLAAVLDCLPALTEIFAVVLPHAGGDRLSSHAERATRTLARYLAHRLSRFAPALSDAGQR